MDEILIRLLVQALVGTGLMLCGLWEAVEYVVVRLRGVIVDAEVLNTYKTYINGNTVYESEVGYRTREGKYVRTRLNSYSSKYLKPFSTISVIYDKRDVYQADRASDYGLRGTIVALVIGLYILFNAKL